MLKSYHRIWLKQLFKSKVHQCPYKVLLSHERLSMTVRSHSSSQEHITLMSSAGQQEPIPALGLPWGQKRSQLQHFCWQQSKHYFTLPSVSLSSLLFLFHTEEGLLPFSAISLLALHRKAVKNAILLYISL